MNDHLLIYNAFKHFYEGRSLEMASYLGVLNIKTFENVSDIEIISVFTNMQTPTNMDSFLLIQHIRGLK